MQARNTPAALHVDLRDDSSLLQRSNRVLDMMTHAKLNHRIEDHRNLDDWSFYANQSVEEPDGMPIDMRFNSGHILSIMVYR